MDSILGRILALIVGALAIVGAYEGYASAMDGQKLQSLQSQLVSFQQNITTQYQRRPGRYAAFTNMPTTTVIANQLAPSSAVNGTNVTNPFNGAYAVVGSGTNGIPVNGFGVWADNIPTSDCIKILETFGTGGGLSGGPFYGYQVAKTINGGGTTNLNVIPTDDTTADTQCNAPASPTVAILFIFNG